MKPILQQEKTGCGIACVASLAGVSYAKAKTEAEEPGITADDQRLRSDTKHMRALLGHY
ncbi:MAG: hypothetical protein G3M70_02655 [Candidatus Nitronauta litoralis]|uniref:Peptidase C39 domain-containing protein n=1 Tax=Candidatus Nitronauta litoralis TaxID=2705533 RepID=A0A7T0FYT1_9BACT|nr:MAG: hypothetical protein G3M70_02655 [Candidatus Nitronauta litoralis]